MSETYLQLKTRLRREIWPGGEAKSLVVPHDGYFEAAMIDLQRWLQTLQKKNVTIFKQCSTYWEDAKTVVEAPKGIIQRVFTVGARTPDAPNQDEWNWRDKVHYWSSNFEDVEIWAKNLNLSLTPENVALAKLQQGFKFAHRTSDDEDGRARIGLWAHYRNRLYTVPFLQSYEALVVEWDGKKTSWADADVLNTDYWHRGIGEAIKLFVKSQHEKNFGEYQLGLALERDYENRRSDLIFDEREETRQQEKKYPISRGPTSDELEDDVALDETADYVTAFVADMGIAGQPAQDVADAILAFSPNKILMGGDLSYSSVAYETTVDPYYGSYRTTNQLTNRLFAIPGNHDLDEIGQAAFEAYFAGNKGNKRYFTVVDGPIQFFFLSTDNNEPDGGYVNASTSTEGSIMGEWLRVQLALSTAKYKVVVGHHSPYTSEVVYTPGNLWMRWPFKAWGAHLYINGHAHNAELAVVDDFPYLTAGIGGASVRGFGAITTGSQWRYNADFGFLKLTANCDKLTVELINRSSEVIQTVEITN
jgi:hypothetical protein